MQTINDAIRWWAKIQPEAISLDFGEERISYRDHHDWSERIASLLETRGLKPGDRVGICAANSLTYCVLILGIMRAGGIVQPLNMRYTAYELSEILEDTTPRFVFADTERVGKFDAADTEVFGLEDVQAIRHTGDDQVSHVPEADAPVVIISTSGSTAKPKGVVFTHRTMTGYVASASIEESSLQAGSRVVVPAPLSTSAGFVQLTHYTVLGCTLFFLTAFEPKSFLNVLVEQKINGFGAVPVFFEAVSRLPEFESADLSSITMATSGGAPVTQELQDVWMKKGIVVRQIYGQTECGGNATIMPAELAKKYPQKCGMGGVFNEIGIVNEAGEPVPPNTIGEIVMRGPGNMTGYWNNPEATAATIRNGWLHSGDLGSIDEEGLLTFVDRMKDIIISGGLNISAAEVERSVLAFPGVEDCMVIAAKDAKFGETPLAVIYARTEIDVQALISHCNIQLSDYKVPRYVAIEIEPLPRTATGKVHKPSMREKYTNAAETLTRVR